jgi:hypothetical protein
MDQSAQPSGLPPLVWAAALIAIVAVLIVVALSIW